MTNLDTASSSVPSVLVAQYVPTTGAAQYTVPAGATTQFASMRVVNNDTVSRTVSLVIVRSGGSAGTTPPFVPTATLAAGAFLDLGELFLGEGDFIWAQASAASMVGLIITGIVFSNSTGAVVSGIQTDAIGSGGRTSGSGVATGTNTIGTGSDRYLLAALMCTMTTTSTSYTTYDSLTMSCTAGSMTKLASVDFNDGGSLGSSVHLFGYSTPTSGSTQTLTTNVAKSGKSFNLTMASLSLSGVASTTGVASTGPSSAAAMSLAVTSAAGHRPFFAAGFDTTPMDFNQRVRAFNGNPAVAFTRPHWLILADALGAGTVTATTSSSQAYCAVGIDLVPA